MPTYLTVPSFGVPNNGINSDNVTYSNQELQNVENVKEALDYITDAYKSRVIFDTYAEFPQIGEPNTLYIDKSTAILYLWNATRLAYVPTSTNIDGSVLQSSL